ncbi:kinetochore protein NUF2 homolog [Malus domestica]|uniref:kinetochore protein NUF2 homolog n=1 Tax=Malus domestica TaxID=3750 RepID=UPI003974CDB4
MEEEIAELGLGCGSVNSKEEDVAVTIAGLREKSRSRRTKHDQEQQDTIKIKNTINGSKKMKRCREKQEKRIEEETSETKMNILTQVVDQLTDTDERRKGWEDKISQLNAEIADYNEAREKKLPLVQEVDAKVKELHQTVSGLNNQQKSLRTSRQKLKEKIGEIEEKIK